VFNLVLTLVGFCAVVAGIWLTWGLGYALLVGGLVLFVTGGVASAREHRGP
jgi:hypothetical protein